MKRTHGRTGDSIYTTWVQMKGRCENPNNDAYADYGGRGIKVCARWQAFENFLADMGERPEGMTLDRENNDGNYEPNNCRWAPAEVQANNKRANIIIEVDGQKMTVAQASRKFGVERQTIEARLKSGWSDDRAAKTDPSKYHKRRRTEA